MYLKIKKMEKREKIYSIATIVISLSVIVLALLGLTRVIDIVITNSIIVPLLGVNVLLSGFRYIKKNKNVAIINFIAAGLIFIACLFVFTEKLFR